MQPIAILLVEDNPGDVMLMRAALGKARVTNELAVATDGNEALDILRRRNSHGHERKIDLGLFDINLPGMSGIELLHQVKSDPELKTTPVIMLSSSEAPKDIQDSYQEHANGYLTKPADMMGLNAIVRAIEDFWLTLARLPSRY